MFVRDCILGAVNAGGCCLLGGSTKLPCKCQDIVRASRSGDVGCTFSGRRHVVMFGLFAVSSPSNEFMMYGACEQYGSAVF